MGVTDTSAAKKCAVCGKEFVVLYQDLWRYKRGMKWMCSWKCLRAYDKKGEKHMGRPKQLSQEQRDKAVQICIDGGDPLKYLEECGVASPRNQWQRIRGEVRDTNPELYQKIPNRRWVKTAVETPEQLMMAPVPEPMNDLVVPESDFQIAALRHPVLGEFYYDRKFKSIDWRTNSGDEVSLEPSCWKLLSELLPEIMKTLGVEL